LVDRSISDCSAVSLVETVMKNLAESSSSLLLYLSMENLGNIQNNGLYPTPAGYARLNVLRPEAIPHLSAAHDT
jgi:hypothetical protein